MPVAAEKKPIVPMNSFTGIPLSTWTFLNTSSAVGPAWPRAVAVPRRQTAAMAAAVRIVCLLPGIHRLLRQRLGNQFIQLQPKTLGIVDIRGLHVGWLSDTRVCRRLWSRRAARRRGYTELPKPCNGSGYVRNLNVNVRDPRRHGFSRRLHFQERLPAHLII